MRTSRHIAAIAAIIVLGVAVGKAADQPNLDSSRVPPPPQATTEESPFGGPPPKKRGVKGAKCKTAQGVCAIDPPQPIGGSCTCSGPDGGAAQGRVEK
jgi:hypothetical protein